jgi:putative colanic acid biosynthesis glycosyltransferase
MKLIQVNVNYGRSSTGKIVEDIHCHALKNGYESYVSYGRGNRIKYSNVVKHGYDIETYFHAFMTRLTGLNGVFSIFSTLKLLRLIKSIQPDIVHLHEIHGYHLNIGMVVNFLKNNNIRTFMTLHSEYMYTGKCGHAKTCDKFMSECGNCPQLREYPKSWILDFTKQMHKTKKRLFKDWDVTIITPSQWLYKRVNLSLLKGKKRQLVLNGIDTNIFNTNGTRTFDDNNPYIFTVIGNLKDPIKNFSKVIEIANRLIELPVTIFVVGYNKKDLKFPSNLKVVPRITNKEELKNFYSNAICTLMVSEYETFSMVTAESIATGTPVVGFRNGGIPEATFGNDEFLTNSTNEIINFIRVLVNNPIRVSANVDYMSSERMSREYMGIYEH